MSGTERHEPEASAQQTERPLTVLLNAASAGDRTAFERLLATVYNELRAIAQARMREERPGHTLEATALVNEAYIRLLSGPEIHWADRGHFFRAAAEAMRKILIDHARARNAQKRGGGRAALSLSSLADLAAAPDPAGLLSLDDAILRLEKVDPEAAEVVRLRFYAGLSEAGVAAARGVSERTVRRDWAFARGWLRDCLEHQAEQERE
jgi:RNA polymerase sigma factor (TIGR02999 family)